MLAQLLKQIIYLSAGLKLIKNSGILFTIAPIVKYI